MSEPLQSSSVSYGAGPYGLPTTLYSTSSGDTSPISINDIHQGAYGDCYLCAVIGELALQDPTAISNMIHDNGDGTQTVTLYRDYSGSAPSFGDTYYKPVQVTVSDADISATGLNSGSWDIVNGVKEIWPQVIELAYAQQNGGYSGIGNGGFASLAMEQLTGIQASTYITSGANAASARITADALAANLANHDLVTFDTSDTSGLPFNLVQDHGYMLEGLQVVDGVEEVLLGNPWGYNQPAAVPLSQIASAFGQIEIGHVGSPLVGSPPSVAPTGGLVLLVSEDAWMGDAQFTVTVDGVQRQGVYTATAPHGSGGKPQRVELGSLGAGQHSIGVTFINDAYGGTPATDRNLYVDGATYNGNSVSASTGALLANGTFNFNVTADVSPTPPPARTVLALFVQEDAWQGDAQFAVSIDGQDSGKTYTANQPHGGTPGGAAGQEFDFQVPVGTGLHQVGITFINDAYGGSSSMDRNLYVTGAAYNGQAISGSAVSLYSNGTGSFSFDSGKPTSSDPFQGVGLSPSDFLPNLAAAPALADPASTTPEVPVHDLGVSGGAMSLLPWQGSNTPVLPSLPGRF